MSTASAPQPEHPDHPGRAHDQAGGGPGARSATAGNEERRLAAQVAEQVGIGLWLVDAGGHTMYRNARLDAWTGPLAHLEELAEWLPGVPLLHYAERVRSGVADAVEEPAVLFRRPDSKSRLVELRLEPGPQPGSVLVTLRDVTDRARLQRLGALVETAVALGHEIANPLAILRGEMELIQEQVPPTLRGRVASMIRAADRIDAVVHKLRRLSETGSTQYLPSHGVRMLDLEIMKSAPPGEGTP